MSTIAAPPVPDVWVVYRAETGEIVRSVLQVPPPAAAEGLRVGMVTDRRIEEIDPRLHRVDLDATARLEQEMLGPQVKVINRPPAEARAAVLPPIDTIKALIAAELAATDAWRTPLPDDRPRTSELTAQRTAFKAYRAALRAMTGDDPADLITRLPVRPGGGDAFLRLRDLVKLDAPPRA